MTTRQPRRTIGRYRLPRGEGTKAMRIYRGFPPNRVRLLAFAATAAVVVSAWGSARADAFIYWANQGGTTAGRSNLDGSAINESLLSGTYAPFAVAVDGQHIYLADFFHGTIQRANLDGSSADPAFITGAWSPRGMAVDGQHIYWATYGYGTVARANLDGTGINNSFISGGNFTGGVAVNGQPISWT